MVYASEGVVVKRSWAAFVIIAIGVWATTGTQAQEGTEPKGTKLETLIHRVSYSLGWQLGKGYGAGIDLGALGEGYRAGLATEGDPALTEQEMREAMVSYRKLQAERRRQKDDLLAKANKEAGEKFLADNKEKKGVVTLPSGMQYKVERRGTGPSPSSTDTVTVHYHGTLIDGKVFDSSVKRGQPSTFPLNGVIRGWTEGLQLMKVGGKWTFYIPSGMAYGARRRSEAIGPNCTLVFEVELISIHGK